MTNAPDRALLSRPLKVEDIGDVASGEIAVTIAEREAIARMLDLVALDRLVFTYRLTRGDEGRFRLNGRLAAEVTQTCVVSLDPVAASLDIPVEVDFWPAFLIDALERSSEEPGHTGLLDWPEAIVDGIIDLGPLIYETLATQLDPYPKREGARFEWHDGAPGRQESPPAGPFAALASLKRR